MRPELRERIIAYNRTLSENRDKAQDLDVIVAAILKLPPGQMSHFLTDDVVAVLAKYGYSA